MESQRVAAIVLAAGGSRRMGSPKMLELLEDKVLVAHAVDAALESQADAVFVVTGCARDEVRAALEFPDLGFVDNPDWENGLASSIRSALPVVEEFDAVMILLGDQPTVKAEILDALIAHFQAGRSLAACDYADGTVGPPALFGRVHYGGLRSLEGDQGARALLADPAAALVPFATGGLDIDTPQDLERARRRTTRSS